MGELWFGAGQDVQNMILMIVGYGIGAGIIIDRALYRGGSEASGEIGNFLPGPEFFDQDYRDFGALESVASGIGIVEKAKTSLKSWRDPEELESLTSDDIFLAARQGQQWAISIINEMADYLAIAVANLTVSFDPELIVFGGSISPFADLLVEPILQRIKNAIPTLPKLVASGLGLRAGAMGAVTNVLHHTKEFYQVRKLS
jgi:glucokinase